MTTRLARRLGALIEAGGPISLADYMALCLSDPADGYYATRDPFGTSGDFTTAPEISQMFGELVGAWCFAAFEAMGAPDAFLLAELGPGRGTLMADLLRAAAIRPAFGKAARLHLIETSPTLRAAQAARLGHVAPSWHDRLDTLPAGPIIAVANEFFDALPIRQFVRTAETWRERVVGLAPDGALAFGLGAASIGADAILPHAAGAPEGTVVELNRPAEAMMATIAARIAREGGAFLTFDYGATEHGMGDTLQAVRGHQFTGVLEAPGEADLTAHMDFAALAAVAANAGARVFGPRAQGHVLLDLGLLERAGRLGAGKNAAEQAAIVAVVNRLAGDEGMGTLFQALAISSGFDVPGFDPGRACRSAL